MLPRSYGLDAIATSDPLHAEDLTLATMEARAKVPKLQKRPRERGVFIDTEHTA